MFCDFDRAMMAEALALARRGLYTTDPNPRVGCVLAKDRTIVGRGFHAFAGGPHAEIAALAEAGEAARGATAYVTLEPCCHTGRTGPCTEALVAAGIARVVYADQDPGPAVAGRGRRDLQDAGIAVAEGLLRDEARALNPGYLSRVERGRPFLRSKIAVSLDGRTALQSGASKWITGDAAREDVQRWRAQSSAIMTGIGTVLQDDPHFDARVALPETEVVQPARVVLDKQLRMPHDARLFAKGGPVHILTTASKPAGPERANIHRVPAGPGGVSLADVMTVLAQLQFNEVLVEAGAILNGALLKAGLVDELLLYVGPHLMGESAQGLANIGVLRDMSDRMQFKLHDTTVIGDDLRLVLRPLANEVG